MKDGTHLPGVSIGPEELARLMPLHVVLDGGGTIRAAGPTLIRLAGDIRDAAFFEYFDVRRPRGITDMDTLSGLGCGTLHLVHKGTTQTAFRAVFVPTADRAGFLINLSFGIDLAKAVNQHGLTLSDFASTDLAVEMLYILEAKTAAMAETRDLIDRLEHARSDAEARSMTDALTGLPNRRGFERHVFRLTDLGVPFDVMAVDLDHFKAVNDRHGHAIGDAVLKEAAARLTGTLRSADIVARVGGDEFLAILKDVADRNALIAAGERLIRAMSAPIVVEGIECRIGASVGIAHADGSGDERAGAMIDRADSALYESKRAGRGMVTVAE